MKVRFEDVITRVTGNVDRYNTELEYYVGGDQYDSSALTIERRGDLKKDVDILGFKFHFPFKSGDVLLMARNPHLRKAGQVFFDGLCSDASYILRTKDEKRLRQNYIPIILQSNLFWDWFESHKTGGITFLLNWGMLKGYEFELPDPDVQDSITKEVRAAYKLKQSYQKLITATDEMVKSRFIEMFGGNGASVKWPKAKLTEIVDSECPISYGIVQPDDDVKDGVPIVRPVDLNVGLYVKREGLKCTTPEISNAYKRTVLRGEELLLCVRGTTGLMGIATEELKGANVTRGITPLFFKPGINRIYVLGAFLSDDIQTYIKEHTIGSTLKGINMEKVRKIEIPVPPIALQNKYEQIFKQADKSKFELKQAIEKIDKVMRALLQ